MRAILQRDFVEKWSETDLALFHLHPRRWRRSRLRLVIGDCFDEDTRASLQVGHVCVYSKIQLHALVMKALGARAALLALGVLGDVHVAGVALASREADGLVGAAAVRDRAHAATRLDAMLELGRHRLNDVVERSYHSVTHLILE